ncbi:MAG: 4Fe-4S double cluster binding domain-containing protein [Candidatus Methanofastidiosia archaeon]|jgi:epoxyqueuosine reductase QueG
MIEIEHIQEILDAEVSLTGVASVLSLPQVPPEFSPHIILKNCKSVLCYGVPIPKGIIYAKKYAHLLYWRYCNMVYRSLDILSNKISILLEEKGYTATPVYGCYPWKVVTREFYGCISLVYWAEQAGIGKLTKCGLLGTPEYGTRVLLGGVLTTAELPQSETIDTEICPSNCFQCIEACPANAIDKTGKVNHNTCIRNAHQNPLLHHILPEKEFSFETVVNTVGIDDHGTYTCFECVKVCPLNT